MNSCIITIIKNEHLYLDEWISYHLGIGINHIFIFEDIDSESHKNIIDKYRNSVTLNSIDIVLNNNGKKEARQLKITKKYSSHYLYLRNILSYMNKNYSNIYDWCFSIDVDEFIALENKNNVNDILSLFVDYDAVVLSWRCYGASGHIHKPNYKLSGVVDSFTEETKGVVNESPSCLCKTCYNIKKYIPKFFGTPHKPGDSCNYCNTEFTKNILTPSFKTMYLKHYITKSWEEYVWKLKVRGFMWGGRRNFDFFFNINPDLNNRKNQLMEELNKEILIVMPYSGKRALGKEVELALLGWKKFCKFNYHFIVIGDFENIDRNTFPWVEFIDCPRVPISKNQYTPHLDIIHKFSIIADKYKNEYDGFFYITDDEYAVKPFDLNDINKTYYHASSFTGVENAPTSYWNHDKWKTRQLLDREGLPHINYTTHFPAYFEFDRLKEICDKYNLYNESYVFDDIYFNYFPHEKPILDSEIRLGIWSKNIFEKDFLSAIENPNIKFMCNSVEGWSKELEDALCKIIKDNLRELFLKPIEVSTTEKSKELGALGVRLSIINTKLCLPYVEVDLTNKCNLNCARCSHFSPLADYELMEYDLKTFSNDIKELNNKFKVSEIRLLGGEPFILNNLLEYAKITREVFSQSIIQIVTNGTLKNKIDSLKPELDKINVKLFISDYGDYATPNYNIKIKKVKEFRALNLNLNPIYNPNESKKNCPAKRCLSLYNGRLYYCPIMKNLPVLEKAFNLDFGLPLEDRSIDLYNTSAKEILYKLLVQNSWDKCCSHCPPRCPKFNWELSDKKLCEWVDDKVNI